MGSLYDAAAVQHQRIERGKRLMRNAASLLMRPAAAPDVRSRDIRNRRVDGRCAGFTLIEALVALGVVAVALTAIGAVVSVSSRGTRSMEQHLALMETTRIVASTLPRNPQADLDGMTGEILGHRWRISLAPFVGSGIYHAPDSQWIPQTVVVRVRSPSGSVTGFETVRLQRKAPPK
jgi:general secretion pathway protein I